LTGTKGTWTYKVYEKTQGTGDYSDLVGVLRTINNGTDVDFSNEFNLDQFLRQAAVETLLLAGDSFVSSGYLFISVALIC
jgi:spore coat protein CotH